MKQVMKSYIVLVRDALKLQLIRKRIKIISNPVGYVRHVGKMCQSAGDIHFDKL